MAATPRRYASARIGETATIPPGEWSQGHAPAAATKATTSKAAGGAGVRHVLRSFEVIVSALAAAAEAVLTYTVRDGATGTGTILRTGTILVKPGDMTGLAVSGLNLIGSANTAMTVEFTAAGAANTYESVGMSGYDV